jgi:transcriptional regulator with XRE-family HTH domain
VFRSLDEAQVAKISAVATHPGRSEPQPGLGRAVRQLRRQAGLSQRQLAERAGISASWLSRIESGGHDPTWGDMRRVAAALDVPLELLSEIAEGYEEG